MIKKANELTSVTTKLRVLIAGYPGVGKSTCALSAPKPLIVDTDRGIMRVSAKHRVDGIIQPSTYEEMIDDLTNNDLSEYETIIFDTGMSLFNLMKYHVILMDAKNGKRDGSLSLQGYGAIGREFQSLMDMAYYKLNKNIVIIFHAKEEKDGDSTRLRILIEGQTKGMNHITDTMIVMSIGRIYTRIQANRYMRPGVICIGNSRIGQV
jgi:pantothenate kinase